MFGRVVQAEIQWEEDVIHKLLHMGKEAWLRLNNHTMEYYRTFKLHIIVLQLLAHCDGTSCTSQNRFQQPIE